MYLEYYGLKREPFHITPDPSFLYLSPSHKEALGAIIYGVEKRKGFIAILGEVGVGKTSILRTYLERKTSQKQKTIYIFNPVLSFHELLISMFRSLELTPRVNDVTEMVNQLHEALIAEYQAGGTIVVAIDEAQNMPVETLENLRMFSNLETATDKLIQIILLGQPELDNLLQQTSLRQLKQRIALWATITPLTREESLLFIEHRIGRASITGSTLLFSEDETIPTPFTKSALNLIARTAEGIPRRINILCDNALITGFGRQCNPVSVDVVKEIIKDIDTKKTSLSSFDYKWAVGFGLLIIIGLFFFFNSFSGKNTVEIEGAAKGVENSTFTKGNNSISQPSALVDRHTPNKDSNIVPETSLNNTFSGDNRSARVQEPQTSSTSSFQTGKVPSPQSPSEGETRSLTDQSISQTENNRVSTPNNLERKSLESDSRMPRYFSGDATNPNIDLTREEKPIFERASATSTLEKNVTRTVSEGESLSQITMEIYGSRSEKYINWVKLHNPQIRNPDFILPGQSILLPRYQNNRESQ